jgi:hypothetical protein
MSNINKEWTIVKNKKNNKKNINLLNDNNLIKKKMLCQNYINNNSCSYGVNCVYAHGINEQIMEPNRKKAYDILNNIINNLYVTNSTNNDFENINNIDLYNIDLSKPENSDLANTFLLMTKLCNNCVTNTCPGGYNCKWGVIDYKYIICYRDLNGIKCNCNYIHLSNYGIKPIKKENKNIKSQNNYNFKNNISLPLLENNNKINNKINNNKINNNEHSKETNNTLLLIFKNNQKKNDIDNNIDNDIDNDMKTIIIEEKINYELSIFD